MKTPFFLRGWCEIVNVRKMTPGIWKEDDYVSFGRAAAQSRASAALLTVQWTSLRISTRQRPHYVDVEISFNAAEVVSMSRVLRNFVPANLPMLRKIDRYMLKLIIRNLRNYTLEVLLGICRLRTRCLHGKAESPSSVLRRLHGICWRRISGRSYCIIRRSHNGFHE